MTAVSEQTTTTVSYAAPESASGFRYAFSAYLLWGFLPFYLKAVAHIPAAEVVAHRILWSLPVAGLTLALAGRSGALRTVLSSPRTLGMAALAAAFLTVNWCLYVWAIGTGRAIEGALGYYINPLFSVLLAAIVLRERLHGLQLAAIGLAVLAVAILGWETGGLPWISLSLAGSWAVYALLKKTLPIEPNQGFFLEVLLLSLPALGYVVWLTASGQAHFGPTGWRDGVLLIVSGPVTAVPLILYANGAKRLKLSTIAMMQYIAPTIVFLIAVFIFREPFGAARALAFALIWAALILYSLSVFRNRAER